MKFYSLVAASASALTLFAISPAKAETFAFDQTAYHIYYNEFDRYAAADWTITNVGVTPTNALTSIDGGALLTTITAADNDGSFLQLPTNGFLFDPAKRLYFKARFKVSDATQSDVIFGLQVLDTTPLAVTDGIWFYKADDAATLSFNVAKASVQTTVPAIATVVANTFMVLEFYYDPGDSSIKYYVDGVMLGETVITNAPNVQALTVSFGLQNGDAVIRNMTTDYVFAAKER